MEKKKINVEDLIVSIEYMEQQVFTEEEKRMFKMGYNFGVTDGVEQGKQKTLEFLDQ